MITRESVQINIIGDRYIYHVSSLLIHRVVLIYTYTITHEFIKINYR